MSAKTFIERQLLQIQQGGRAVLFRKMERALQMLFLCTLAVPSVLVIRFIRPWLLVRWGGLHTGRIGHFIGDTEMYLCEQDAGINVPTQRHVDIFHMGSIRVCNQQLESMWRRVLRIWPVWILGPFSLVNRLVPGGAVHEIGDNTQGARDVHNLMDRFPPHLEFTSEEEAHGKAGMRAMGITIGTPFVCLIVRDSAFLDAVLPSGEWSYHNYRDCDIQNYVLAAEALADRGYFVIRMGAKVKTTMKTAHPRVIDYATNGMRSDFMDIYLGAKCEFCISTGTGFDTVPRMFRRPIVYTNMVPLGHIFTHRTQFLSITRRHLSTANNRELALSEIFNHNVGFCFLTDGYASKDIELIENTPEEIRDVVIEMAERLNGTWQLQEDDEALQRRFWEIFPIDSVGGNGRPMHGEIRARFGAHFLRNNLDWLQ